MERTGSEAAGFSDTNHQTRSLPRRPPAISRSAIPAAASGPPDRLSAVARSRSLSPRRRGARSTRLRGDSRSEDRDGPSLLRSPARGETGVARKARGKSGGARHDLPLPTRDPLESDLAPGGGRGRGRFRRLEAGWPSRSRRSISVGCGGTALLRADAGLSPTAALGCRDACTWAQIGQGGSAWVAYPSAASS